MGRVPHGDAVGGLRVSDIDPLTGEVPEGPADPLARERMLVQVLESDLQLAEVEIRTLRRTIAAKDAELNRRLTEGTHGKVSKVIALYYAQRLKKTKSWRFGPKRQKVVIERLKEEFDGLYIARAIDGIAIGAYSNPANGVVYNDLELVCRNEVNLERFHQIAEANEAMTMIDAEWESLLKGERVRGEDDDPESLPI